MFIANADAMAFLEQQYAVFYRLLACLRNGGVRRERLIRVAPACLPTRTDSTGPNLQNMEDDVIKKILFV